MEIKGYRDLRVWQAAMDLAVEIHQLTLRFPDSERFGLVTTLRRLAGEIPSNIAMGHTLEATRDYLWNIDRAQGHLAGLQTQLELAGRYGYPTQEQLDKTLDRAIVLAKQLFALRNALRQRGD